MIVVPRQPVLSDINFPSYPMGISSIMCPVMQPCQPDRRQPATPSMIERLPHELQRLIFSNLDYQSLIFLSTTNRHFNQLVKPREMADPMDKFQFVMTAAKDFAQHRPSEKGQDHKPGNFECYICFRVRAPEHFDVLQPQSAYFDPRGRGKSVV